VLFIKDNGKINNDMVMEYRYGLTELNMRDIGLIIKLMEGENSGMQMVMFMMENGKTIKLMDLEPMFICLVQNTLVNGSMIFRMEKELKNGSMEADTRVSIKKAKNMVTENIDGVILHNMRVNG
jgi:hypothetical protein